MNNIIFTVFAIAIFLVSCSSDNNESVGNNSEVNLIIKFKISWF